MHGRIRFAPLHPENSGTRLKPVASSRLPFAGHVNVEQTSARTRQSLLLMGTGIATLAAVGFAQK